MGVEARFDFYPADWLNSGRVREMSLSQQGLYMDLLCQQWVDGFLPVDPERIARRVQCPVDEFMRLWPGLLAEAFPVVIGWRSGGDLGSREVRRNPRLHREREAAEKRAAKASEDGKKGNQLRWNKGVSRRSGGDRDPMQVQRSPSPSPSPSPFSSAPTEMSTSLPGQPLPRKPSGPHQEFIAWWCETFEAVCGRRYGFDGGKDGKAVKAILGLAGGALEEAKERALLLLHAAPEWIDDGGRDLVTLRSQWNRLVSMGTGRTSGSKQLAIKDALVPQSSGLLDMPTARKP